MTGIRRTALLAHPIRVTPDRVEAYRVELPGQPAACTPIQAPSPATWNAGGSRSSAMASPCGSFVPVTCSSSLPGNHPPLRQPVRQ